MVKTLELMTISTVGDIWTCPTITEKMIHLDYGFAWRKADGSTEPVKMIQSVIELDGWVKYVLLYKVGDWVYDESYPQEQRVYQVNSELLARDMNDGKYPHVRKATEVEVEYEKERRWWEYIGGRKIGELKTGDIVTVDEFVWFISVVDGVYYKTATVGEPGVKIDPAEKVKLLVTCTMILKK